MRSLRRLLLVALCALGTAAVAQTATPVTLTVDASQAPLKLLRIRMRMPVQAGALTLYYPKWIPGEHEPDGPIGNVTGLHFSAGGKEIPWNRDPLDVFTFHLEIPPGVSTLDVAFDYIEGSSGEYTSVPGDAPTSSAVSDPPSNRYQIGCPPEPPKTAWNTR